MDLEKETEQQEAIEKKTETDGIETAVEKKVLVNTKKTLRFQDREIILLGTAHVSKESCEQVAEAIAEENPDCIAIELDEERLASMKNPNSWKNLDIVKVLKENKGFVLLANLVLSSFQKRLGANVGVKPGDEMRAALEEAEKKGIATVMVDRPIQITLKRAWATNSFWGKMKLLSALIASAFETETISAEEIEKLKNSNEMDAMMNELAEYLPSVKKVLIDERDEYLAKKIWTSKGEKILAVLGAGHLPGVERQLEKLSKGETNSDTSAISEIPAAGIGGKIAGYIFPALIVGLIVAGFFTGGAISSLEMLLRWLLWNGSLAALGTLLALGHPLAILVGFFGAPIATLNPVLGVGLFTGLTQAWIRKPKVEDMETLQEDLSSIKKIYKNRILRVLLVFILSSVGGVIGNFIAVPALFTSLIN
ncbi:MAG TPA: TraB/GumN family protein [Treponemataceae bacterium]|nr:TraB/GumN family protein [Treponemataceae bacterium]